ncbi:MAG: HAD family hydrolase [Anaerolineae bacterium]|nr:HAD family hydrolase [Anaerolineae bacterium]
MIRTIVIDCDGVLTSGKQYIDHTGEKFFKAFHSKDIRAIRELIAAGIDVVVMSADDWKGAVRWCDRVGCRFICTRDKLQACLEQGLDPGETLVVGDDAWDVQALKWAGYKYAPLNSSYCVSEIEGLRWIGAEGGHGVIAVLLLLLEAEGLL